MTPVQRLCREAKVSDYLEARGVELIRSGKRVKCKCPLPDHPNDNTPSFNIGEFPDGGEYFKCFGCGKSGNVISLIRLMEGKKKGQIVKELSRSHGVDVSRFSPGDFREPADDEVVALFCEEESAAMKIATYAKQFLRSQGGREDAVNKVSRLYERLDKMIEDGDEEGMEAICEEMGDLLIEYGRPK